MWLRPLVEAYPKTAPSQFFLIDTLLALDGMLDEQLLMQGPVNGRIEPTSRQKKVELASEEVGRIRRLYSTLRYLYRNGDSFRNGTFLLRCAKLAAMWDKRQQVFLL